MRHFSFSFPAAAPLDHSTVHATPTILLIEDSLADIGLVREALEEHQVRCELTVIINGERALHYLDEIHAKTQPCPSLFIIDLNLPRQPGTAVLQRARELGVCQQIPVIVLTSSDDQKDKDAVAKFPGVRYLRKPSRLDEFMVLGGIFQEFLYPPATPQQSSGP